MKIQIGTSQAYFHVHDDNLPVIGLPFISVREFEPKIPSKIGALQEIDKAISKQMRLLRKSKILIASEIAKISQLSIF